MDPTTLVYGLLAAAGLVGADAYFSSDTIYLQVSVAPAFEQKGFNHDLVEAFLVNELQSIASTDTILDDNVIVPRKDRPLSAAFAEVVGMTDALQSAKSKFGINDTQLVIGVVVDSVDGVNVPRIVATANKINSKPFSVALPLDSETRIDAALFDAALLTMREVDPYITALYLFEKSDEANEYPTEAIDLIANRLKRSPTPDHSSELAPFENLKGVSYLFSNDTSAAHKWFDNALTSDPKLEPAKLNAAFMLIQSGNLQQAIELAEPFSNYDSFGQSDDGLVSFAANILLGVAYTALGEFKAADGNFERAISIRPEDPTGYFYWARSLMKRGQMPEAEAAYRIAERNTKRVRNYHELAALSFWLPSEVNGRVQRRTDSLPSLQEAPSP